jgi:hypothetical protein
MAPKQPSRVRVITKSLGTLCTRRAYPLSPHQRLGTVFCDAGKALPSLVKHAPDADARQLANSGATKILVELGEFAATACIINDVPQGVA